MEIAIILITIFLSAVAHEYDMSRNYKKYGDARAWFFEIKK